MSQKNETIVLLGALAITGAIVAGGGWWLWNRLQGGNASAPGGQTPQTTQGNPNSTTLPPPTQPQATDQFASPPSVPSGTTISIAGSTSMVTINEALKTAFQSAFPGTTVNTDAEGSDAGIVNLLLGKVDISASSRPLTPQEIDQSLAALPIANDGIAIVVGKDNPFQGSLTLQQVRDIFTGAVTNWSQVGGSNAEIKVINRPTESGTRQIFERVVLQGANFGSGSNVTTLDRDATTPILRALGSNGISYATYVQVENQQTVRILPVDNQPPTSPNYPLHRQLYYVYKQPPSEPVKVFLGFATSPQGQLAIAQSD